MADSELPFLIIGQGLAGSALAWRLMHAGARVLVIDRPVTDSSSRVAAGLVNPLSGRKVKPEWRQAECLPAAHSYYRETEKELGGSWWQTADIWRELNADQLLLWEDRRLDPESAAYAGPLLPWLSPWKGQGHAAVTYGSAVLHAESLIEAQRSWLQERDSFEEADLQVSDLRTEEDGRILWKDRHFQAVIWCVGYEVAKQLDAPWLEARMSQGCILDIQFEEEFLPPDIILHFGHWLVRRGDIWRLGASYDWHWGNPSEPAMTSAHLLMQVLDERYDGQYEVKKARAAVRPIIRYSQPVVGAIPERAGHYMLGGLGSRGCTTAPWVSERLAEHLMTGVELPDDLIPLPLYERWKKRQLNAKQ